MLYNTIQSESVSHKPLAQVCGGIVFNVFVDSYKLQTNLYSYIGCQVDGSRFFFL